MCAMTILGIDTSLRSTGYGVLKTEGSRLTCLDCGNIPNGPRVPLTGCLKNIHAKVAELIAAHRPDVVAIESVIYGKNAGTMLVLGEARGAVLTAAADEEGDLRERARGEGADPADGEDAPQSSVAAAE